MTKIFGIKNCDTMKKAFKWLEANAIPYEFHDYKKQGIEPATLAQAIQEHGWEVVINKRGTTWRKLPEDLKNTMDAEQAVKIATENPSIVKRPLLSYDGKTHFGFKEDLYLSIFKA